MTNNYATLYATLRLRKLALIDLAILDLVREESMTPSAIARTLRCSCAHVTCRVQRLEDRGLVLTRQGQANRRKVWVSRAPGQAAEKGGPHA